MVAVSDVSTFVAFKLLLPLIATVAAADPGMLSEGTWDASAVVLAGIVVNEDPLVLVSLHNISAGVATCLTG